MSEKLSAADITKSKYKQIFLNQKSILAILLLVFIIILIIADRNFFSPVNTIGIIDQLSVNGIMAIGMTILLISGSFDISIGSVMAISSIIAVILQPYGLILSIIMGLIVGLAVGTLNGLLVVKGKINSFIVTLGTMFMVKGFGLAITKSQPISSKSDFFNNISQGSIFGVHYIIFYFIILFVISWFILTNTKFGMYSYAIGSNETSARLAGIKTNVFRILYFIFCSLMAAIAGVLFASKVGSGSAVYGDNVVIMVMTTVILGGTSLSGGKGNIIGTLEALILLVLIDKGMVIFDIPLYWQQIFKGSIILIVIVIDVLGRKRERFAY